MKRLLKRKTPLAFIVTILFLAVTSYFYVNKSAYIHFVDEEENMVTGKYLLEQNLLYKDVFATHQPITYYLSSGVQKLTNPDSVFLLVKRHRLFVIGWAAFWSLLLVLRFGPWMLGFVTFYELTKIFLLGNLFLAESLVVYPLVYLTAIVYKGIKKISNRELVFLGFALSLAVFLLAPVWPLILFLLVILIYRIKKNQSSTKYIFFGASPLIILLLLFVPINDYFRDVFVFNIKYFIPLNTSQLGQISLVNSFVSPILTFLPSIQLTKILLSERVLSFFLIFTMILLFKKKRYFLSLLMVIVLGLANIRFIQPGLDYYRGFHLTVWYSLLILSVVLGLSEVYGNYKDRIQRKLTFVILLILFFVSVSVSRNELFVKRDPLNDYYINYSQMVDIGEAVKIMKGENNTLFVAPDETLVYWQAGIYKASSFVFYYPFMVNVPFTQDEVNNVFSKNPPTFVYCKCEEIKPLQDKLMSSKYKEIFKDSDPTSLFVLKDKLKTLDNNQLDRLNYYRFEI